MWGQIGGENKIVIARRVLEDLVEELPESADLGLVAYGHRREGDCADIETLAVPGEADRATVVEQVKAINPKGRTPITAAINEAVEGVRERGEPTTVILLSDGLETCGGDPCAAVRAAREAGVPMLLHVIGFDVGDEDVSQLECAAQAGGGLYLDASDAESLASAFDQAVEVPAEGPTGFLSVRAVADGELADASVQVFDTSGADEIAHGRTYESEETNPRAVPLPAGIYDVRVRALDLRGDTVRRFEGIEIVKGETVEREVDFSSGELAVTVTHNGELGDAVVRVYVAGTTDEVGAGRTYTRAASNPEVMRLTVGTYDVTVGSVEIASGPEQRFEGVVVGPGERAERAVAFESGTLRIGATHGAELVDVVVSVIDTATGKKTKRGRTYVNPSSNPGTFVVPPGEYRVTVGAVRLEGRPQREFEVTVAAGETVERIVDFAQ